MFIIPIYIFSYSHAIFSIKSVGEWIYLEGAKRFIILFSIDIIPVLLKRPPQYTVSTKYLQTVDTGTVYAYFHEKILNLNVEAR